MGPYIQRRLIITVPILVAVTAVVFLLLQFTPGDPLDAYIPPDVSMPAAQRAALRHALGLDRPLVLRYVFWLRNTVEGNLGYRSTNFQPVGEAIKIHIGPTLLLMGTGMVIGIVIGLILGVISALKQYSVLDIVLTVGAFGGISIPAFLAGLIGLYVFAVLLHWFPAGGIATPGQPFSLGDLLHHLILPAALLALNYVAIIMRYTRASLLEVLGEDYMRTGRAKGLRESTVIVVHGLRNALLPVVTIIGAQIPNLLGGAVFLETIFSWPGMGQLYLEGIAARDYNLIMGITLILAVAILLANLLTDLAYAVIDPRIRYG
ncbi:MAG TPA: ABC transporter permease [Thermomicrobiaceae bacterium]|nr:ABC transporter permease [Thermomicrobiaceae bacterium]